MGVLMRRMLDTVETTDMREIICTMPVCAGELLVDCIDHMPVEKANRNELVIRLVLK